jgi:hypothetical protein
MQTRRLTLALTLVAVAALSISCAASRDAGEPEFNSVGTYDELVAALRNSGSIVESLDPISQPFFEPDGQVVKVDGHEIQVFEFSNEGDLLSAGESISSDGSSVGTTMISWVEAPHFFRSGNLIVLYVGEVDAIVEALQAILGPQIAGR